MYKRLVTLLAGVAFAVALFATPAVAAKGPPAGRGETETLGNNLSVPAIFVPTSTTTGAPALRVPCAAAPQAPIGAQSGQFPGYWLQKSEATWSATCAEQASAAVSAQWGANLTDAPSVATGKPIRVEVSLLDKLAAGTGYVITNLTPELEDRLATYGTDGTTFQAGVNGAPFTRVWGPGATLTITNTSTHVSSTYPLTAEINSSGAAVYGYNWGSQGSKNTPAAGTYLLTFSIGAAVAITGVEAGALRSPVFDTVTNTSSIQVTLTAANRGGGGGHGGSGR